MDSASAQRVETLDRPRRAYKRISAQRWEEHKDRIRELFIEQSRTCTDVVCILKDSHGLEIGERQLKRKTDAWGFTKKISYNEMRKMACKKRRRQDELAKSTKFWRRHRDGEFQEVAQEKLDRFHKRFGLSNISSMSSLSSMPSNIIYGTPSSDGQYPCTENPLSSHSSAQITREFNDSVEKIFDRSDDYNLSYRIDSASVTLWGSNDTISNLDLLELSKSALNLTFSGEYRVAGQKYKLLSLRFAKTYGLSDWRTVTAEFNAALMRVADFPGCPQTILARFSHELSLCLRRERQRYIHANPQARSLLELRKTLTSLNMNTEWVSQLVTQQRALLIWEPLLGPKHPKIKLMQNNIAHMRVDEPVDLNTETWRTQDAENLLPATLKPDDMPQLRSVGNMLYLGSDSRDLLDRFRALENGSVTSRRIERDIELQQFGRSRSLLGAYYSFLQRFDEAERAFQESNLHMTYETCVEIKLHRIVWYAEHKTRVQDVEGVGKLISQAHHIYMKNESPSEFIVAHFRSDSITSALRPREGFLSTKW